MPPPQSPLKTHVSKSCPVFGAFSILVLLDTSSFFFCEMKRRSLSGSGHLLNLNLGHSGAGAAEVGDLSFGVLGVVVADGGLDGVFGKHRAVDWDRC